MTNVLPKIPVWEFAVMILGLVALPFATFARPVAVPTLSPSDNELKM